MISERCKIALKELLGDFKDEELIETNLTQVNCFCGYKPSVSWAETTGPMNCELITYQTVALEPFQKGKKLLGLAGKCRKCHRIYCKEGK